MSIATDMDAIRDSFGICPQQNVLFDRLTVKEHLEFFSALKGQSKAEGAEEIRQLIEDIQLTEKTNEKVFWSPFSIYLCDRDVGQGSKNNVHRWTVGIP